MVLALASVRVGLVVAVVVAAVVVGDAWTVEAAQGISLSAGSYSAGLCQSVTLSATGKASGGGSAGYMVLSEITPNGRHTLKSGSSGLIATHRLSYSVSHCEPGLHNYQASFTQTGYAGVYSEVVGVEWKGEVSLETDHEHLVYSGSENTAVLTSSVEPTAWTGYTLKWETRDLNDAESEWSTPTALDNGAVSQTVSYSEAARRAYRVILTIEDVVVVSPVAVVEWVDVLPSPTPIAANPDLINARSVVIGTGDIYTNAAPIVSAIYFADADEADVLVDVHWNLVEHATSYTLRVQPKREGIDTLTFKTDSSETLSGRKQFRVTNPFAGGVNTVEYDVTISGELHNPEIEPLVLETASGLVVVNGNSTVSTPSSDPVRLLLRPGGSGTTIDRESAGNPDTVAPGAAPEGITEVARLIAQHTGMGAGAATTLLPLLCLLLAGGAAAVVVLPLGFSPLSLAAGFLVFTLVWSVGGVAWFGLPIAVAALPPVLLAASGVMIVRRRGMFG